LKRVIETKQVKKNTIM